MIMEYPKRLGAEDQDIQDAEAIMMFEAAHKPGKPSCELLQDLLVHSTQHLAAPQLR
jgi:hypothetical protein